MPDEPPDDDALEPDEFEGEPGSSEPAGEPGEVEDQADEGGDADEPAIEPVPDEPADEELSDESFIDSLTDEERDQLGAAARDIAASIPTWYPSFEVPKFDFGIDVNQILGNLPKFDLGIRYDNLFPEIPSTIRDAMSSIADFEAVRQSFASLDAIMRPTLDLIREQILAGLSPVDEDASSFPPNWDIDESPSWEDVLKLVMEEGLPLAWVPGPVSLSRVVNGELPSARRGVYGSRWRSITDDCLRALSSIPDESPMATYRDFAILAANGLRDGHHQLSQAMSVNLYDTVLNRSFPAKRYRSMVDQNKSPKLDDDSVSQALVFGGVWASHGRFRGDRLDPPPRKLSRHASAHGVSRRQYTRVNAVLALCHVTGLLSLLDSEA